MIDAQTVGNAAAYFGARVINPITDRRRTYALIYLDRRADLSIAAPACGLSESALKAELEKLIQEYKEKNYERS